MTYPKLLAVFALVLFGTIALMAFFKNNNSSAKRPSDAYALAGTPLTVELEGDVRPVRKVSAATRTRALAQAEAKALATNQNVEQQNRRQEPSKVRSLPPSIGEPTQKPLPPGEAQARVDMPALPDADRIAELFNKGEPKLPFVETIVYKSSVPWHKGRSAWLADYANYYNTSRHFIARSLNGKPDYLKQDVFNGDRFNVFRKDKNIEFYLLVDLSRQKVWFYALDADTKERTLLKTYRVGLGRPDASKASGYLTPIGKYQLGSKVSIHQPKSESFYKGEKIETMRVFGSRWIPFEKEIAGCSEPAKGFGIHGLPWHPQANGSLVEDKNSIGRYESDGCIRFYDADVKELFAIIITKPTTIELVKDFYDAKLPGVER